MHLWRSIPNGLRRAAGLAVVTALVAGGMLYQLNVRGVRPPDFSRGGSFDRVSRDATPRPSPSPAPNPTGASSGGTDPTPGTPLSEGSASTVPDGGPPPSDPQPAPPPPRPDEPPALGTYAYRVDGYEQATGFGRRSYPDEMTLAAHRHADDLAPDEVVFDIDFSENHEEREIVAYRSDGMSFTYEAGSVTFGPTTQSSEATYHPPMLQTPFPLEVGAARSGTSEARGPDGEVVRTEDWTVEILRTERIHVLGEDVDTWVVRIERRTRPGSSEQVERRRTYWFDPGRRMWVQWDEFLRGERAFGPGTFTYQTEYTATLAEAP